MIILIQTRLFFFGFFSVQNVFKCWHIFSSVNVLNENTDCPSAVFFFNLAHCPLDFDRVFLLIYSDVDLTNLLSCGGAILFIILKGKRKFAYLM